jgi:hypothetical protein
MDACADLNLAGYTVSTNHHAVVAVSAAGAICWGDPYLGGACDGLDLANATVYATDRAFAAVQPGGTVVCFGDEGAGGACSELDLAGTTRIHATCCAFAAVKVDGSVVCWGHDLYGGSCSALNLTVSSSDPAVYATREAFAALQPDGSILCWGNTQAGGDCAGVSGLGIPVMIASTCCAFAALTADQSVVCWGDAVLGGDCTNTTVDWTTSPVLGQSTGMVWQGQKFGSYWFDVKRAVYNNRTCTKPVCYDSHTSRGSCYDAHQDQSFDHAIACDVSEEECCGYEGCGDGDAGNRGKWPNGTVHGFYWYPPGYVGYVSSSESCCHCAT